MQINPSSLNVSLRSPTTAPQRSAAVERENQVEKVTAVSARQSQSLASAIQSVLSQRESDNQRNNEMLERNPRNRMALQSYFENGPTLEQQLDVELAGIDTYV